MLIELNPQFDSVKSYYNKAQVKHTPDSVILYSYNTMVCIIPNKTQFPIVYGTYSTTTLRHIKEFLKQAGFKADSKSQILKDYGIR